MRGGITRQQDNERAAHREAMQQPASATRGQEGGAGRNERTRRGDAKTSWHDELMRGWRNERMARGDATTSWHDKTMRGRCNEGATRGDATTSWHDKTTPGWCGKSQHNLIVFWVQMKSTGEVAAMVMLVMSVNQNDCALEMNCK